MSTITKTRDGNYPFQRIVNKWSSIKDAVCKDGALCQDLFTLGSLAVMVWFMYIAMEPILIFS